MFTVRRVVLQAMDMFWIEHLEVMDYMRSSVNLRAYGQRDPLVEYKKEGLRLFKEMEAAVEMEVAKILPRIEKVVAFEAPAKLQEVQENAQEIGSRDGGDSSQHEISGEKIGRNEPCPCGSGIKYKNCGLINAPEHKQ